AAACTSPILSTSVAISTRISQNSRTWKPRSPPSSGNAVSTRRATKGEVIDGRLQGTREGHPIRAERSAGRGQPRQVAGLRGRHARHDPGDRRGGGQALRERSVPAEPQRRRGRLPLRERRGAYAQG